MNFKILTESVANEQTVNDNWQNSASTPKRTEKLQKNQ